MVNVDEFEIVLAQALGLPNAQFSQSVRDALRNALSVPLSYQNNLRHGLAVRLKHKLELNKAALGQIYGTLAARKVALNRVAKTSLVNFAAEDDRDGIIQLLQTNGATKEIIEVALTGLELVSDEQAFEAARREIERPTRLRKAERDVTQDFVDALAGPMLWSICEWGDLAQYFSGVSSAQGLRGYLRSLNSINDSLMKRDRVLSIRHFYSTDQELEAEICQWLSGEFEALNNYGYAAFIIDDVEAAPSAAWTGSLQGILWGENLAPSAIKQMFFRKSQVREQTIAMHPDIDADSAKFELAYEGFSYRDTFVFANAEGNTTKLLVLLQKNVRDEELLPCPSCRSFDVEGNSYPDLGVKSWACRNVLCPDRSLYNRGRRYQLKSLIAQAALEDLESQIDEDQIRTWQRDVQPDRSLHEVVAMLVCFYSLSGDGIAISVPGIADGPFKNRRRNSSDPGISRLVDRDAVLMPLFARVGNPKFRAGGDGSLSMLGSELRAGTGVYHGDSTKILASWDREIFSAAVTSPPYYNAREYSQWPNLYAYLRDMMDNAAMVLRALKPGGTYSYNIFDYFDNPNTIVFSDMGRRRIPLASYITALFLRLGFELITVDVWDKGHIHGKRGHNGGNRSPFYQSPFNCWEHILVFRKPNEADQAPSSRASVVRRIHPVVKMIAGKNIVGHSAPYPETLVLTQIQRLPKGSIVLDPYLGSGTTVVAAERAGCRGVGIELNENYAAIASRNVEIARRDSVSRLDWLE